MIHVSLITPEKVHFQGDADSVSLPTTSGQIQILQDHMPLVTILSPGELKIVQGGETTYLAVSGGYVEVRPGNKIVVLANSAEIALEIDIDRAEAARARARELLKGKIASEEEYATVVAMIQKEWARVNVGRKHVSHRRPSIGE